MERIWQKFKQAQLCSDEVHSSFSFGFSFSFSFWLSFSNSFSISFSLSCGSLWPSFGGFGPDFEAFGLHFDIFCNNFGAFGPVLGHNYIKMTLFNLCRWIGLPAETLEVPDWSLMTRLHVDFDQQWIFGMCAKFQHYRL